MKNTTKRILSLILSMAMLVSLAPSVYATEGVAEPAEPTAVTEQETAPAEATEEDTEASEEATEVTEEATEATEEATEATEEATEAPEEATEATEETTEATEATEEVTEATEENAEETEEVTAEEELGEEAEEAAAATGEHMKAAGMTVISKTSIQVAEGVSYDKIISRNASSQQNIGFLTKVDLSKNVAIKAAYGNYYTAGSTAATRAENVKDLKWSLSKTTILAAEYESAADHEGTVVMATNGDYFNMGTGEPLGYLIMEGNARKIASEPYFAILKDGTAVIRDGGTDTSDVLEAVSGPFLLVRDGQNVAPADTTLMPRNSVGICADGSVVFYLNDGRQAPTSVGMTLPELASVLQDAGCVTALYLDGGGSATVAARPEGASKLQVINTPSDGAEREVSSALLVVSTAKATGEFDHASITPNDELYTPGSQVQFSATGVDSAGSPADIPEDVQWVLAESCADMGTLDANGLFKAAEGKTGIVTVQMQQDGKTVGSAFIELVKPDEIRFNSEEISLGFEKTTDFGMVVRYQERDIHIKNGDIVWTTTNEELGTFDGNLFTSSDGASLNGDVTATSAYDETVSASIHVIVGMLPTSVWDFEDHVMEDGTVIPAEEYYCGTSDGILTHGNYGRGGKESIEIVSIDDGEPVRFGEKSLKLNFDFTQCGEVTEGAIVGTKEGMTIPGTPTAIGVWVYAPEGVGVTWKGDGTQAGFWLRGYVSDGTGTLKPYDFTLEPKAIPEPKDGSIQPGIYWEGWKYLEADLSNIQPPYSIVEGNTFRLMFVNGTKMGTRTANCIYFDNLQFVYGANVDDVDSPKVDSIKIGNTELNNGDELTSGTIPTLRTTFSDVQNKYTSGVDANTVRVYIDGVNVVGNDRYEFALSASDGYAELYNLKLTEGSHSVTVSLRDNFGNDVSETRYFTVKGNALEGTSLTIAPAESIASLGGTVNLELRASDDTVTDADVTVRLSNMFPDVTVEFSENYEGTFNYTKASSTVTISAHRKEDTGAEEGTLFALQREGTGTDEGNLIAKIVAKVPATLTESENYLFEVKSASYTTSDGFYGTKAVAETKLPVGAGISVVCDPVLVGGAKAVVSVLDTEGKAVAGAGIYLSENDTQIGTTDENGQWETDYFSAAPATVSVYAKAEDGRLSFQYNVVTYASAAETEANVLFNAVSDSTTQKSISWISDPLNTEAQCLRYRIPGGEDTPWTTVEADTVLRTFNKGGDFKATNFNSVRLTGLAAGTTYEYQMGSGDVWTETASFATDTGAGSGVKFFVMSDIQADDRTNVNNMVSYIKEGGYQFGIQTGDAIDDMTSYDQVVEAAKLLGAEQLGDIDVVHVLGNHEYAGDANAQIAGSLFNLPASAPGSHYSISYGDVYVAVINYTATDAQLIEALEWLVKDAQESNATWKILTMHQPPYYTNAVGGNAPINKYVPAAAEEAGIDVVFSGHDHSATRTNPLTGGEIDEENGIVYYIGGSSGEKSYGISSQNIFDYDKIFKLATANFTATYIDVSADKYKMDLTFYNVTGEGGQYPLDVYTLYTGMGTCAKAGHELENAVYSEGKLTCNNCGDLVDPVAVEYTGWAIDKETGRSMYLINGVPTTGAFLLEKDTYYFDENGVALQGKVTVDDVEREFENGLIVGGYTGFVKKDDGKLYHYTDGLMDHGWYQDGEDWYYFDQVTGAAKVGTAIYPDDEAILRKARYDFGEDGKLLSGYFNVQGVYYWAGERMAKAFVKNPEDPDKEAWYVTNSDGHFVTDGSENPTVEYMLDGVVYTIDNTNGKLLSGNIIQKNGRMYYYWAGEPFNGGWFEFKGNTYYAYPDGHLAKGSCVIDGEARMFNNQCVLVTEGLILTAVLPEDNTVLTVKLVNADAGLEGTVFAIWGANAGQKDTLKWIDGVKAGETIWTISVPMCQFQIADTFIIHVYSTKDGMREERLIDTTVEVPVAVDHTYTDDYDSTCNVCGAEREIPEAEFDRIYRLYNPNTLEHLLCGETEMESLVKIGWSLDGLAWYAPKTGTPIYRLYNPYDDFHFYTSSQEEIDTLTPLGWTVDGVVSYSASEDEGAMVYRMFNPYEKTNYHLFTADYDECEWLASLGWILEGAAWYCIIPE